MRSKTTQSSVGSPKQERNPNLELLRIFAILIILLDHFTGGVVPFVLEHDKTPYSWGLHYASHVHPHTFGIILGNILQLGGMVGVCLFFLISGYFMINSTFKPKKFLTLWKLTIFYSLLSHFVVLTIKSLISPPAKFVFSDLAKCLFPIEFSTFWFITAYVIIMAMSSFLNQALKKLSKRQFLFLLFFWGTVAYSFFTLPYFSEEFHIPTDLFSKLDAFTNFQDHLPHMIFFYCIGAYFSLHKPKRTKTVFFSSLIVATSLYAFYLYSLWSGSIDFGKTWFTMTHETPFGILFSLPIFIFFSNLKVPSRFGKSINFLAKPTLEVYLFHTTLFSLFQFIVLEFSLFQIPSWQFSKLILLGFPTTLVCFFLCIIFANFRAKLSRHIFNLKPLVFIKQKICSF